MRGRPVPRAVVPALLALIGVSLCCSRLAAAPVDDGPEGREALTEQLKGFWDSLGSLEFGCDEFLLDGSGARDRGQPYQRLVFRRVPGNRHAMELTTVSPGGAREMFYEMREDGRRHYRVVRVPGHPEVVDFLSVKNIEASADEYGAMMSRVLWVIMPGGRPLYQRLDEGAALEAGRGADGSRTFAVVFRHKGGEVRCELDREHDWLPRRVTIGSTGRVTISVTRFARDNGRWFPAEGAEDGPVKAGGRRVGFEVVDLKINRPIPESAFGPPPLTEGTIVQDFTTGKGSTVGGLEARRRFEAKYRPATPASGPAGAPLGPARATAAFPWTAVLAFGSFGCFVGAVLLRFGHHRPGKG